MGNEASQPDEAGDATTPMSDYATQSVVSEPVRPTPSMVSIRRGSRSQASSAQHSPEEAPQVDLSHLNEEERAQIVAVMARATQLQEEETQRLR